MHGPFNKNQMHALPPPLQDFAYVVNSDVAPLRPRPTPIYGWMTLLSGKRFVVKIIYFYNVECSPSGYLVCLVAFFIRIIIIFWDAQNLCTALHDQYLPYNTAYTDLNNMTAHTDMPQQTAVGSQAHNNQCDKNNLCCCCLFIWFPIGCVPHYCSKVVWRRPQISY